jgi:hypothetical protein
MEAEPEAPVNTEAEETTEEWRQQVEAFKEQGNEAFKQGNNEEAIRLYAQVLVCVYICGYMCVCMCV